MRLVLLLATALGLGVAIWTIGSVGLGAVATAAARIGAGGFILLCLWQLGLLGLLGLAWLAAADGLPWRSWPLLAWARMVREAASDILPFSHLGGIVLGARAATAAGLAPAPVYGGLLIDLVAEMAAQIVFTLFGLVILRDRIAQAAAGVERTALVGVALVLCSMLGFAFSQKALLKVIGRLANRVLPGAAVATEEVRAEIDRIYARRAPVLGSFALNLVAWIGTGFAAWLALRLMGVHASLAAVFTIESLVFVLRSVAFMVPGAIGVQEAAYLLLGPLFGIAPAAGLALSLVKRARDLAIGVPVLLAWQAGEARKLRAARAG